MKTRKEVLDYGLSFPDTYQDAPFHDANWQLVRVRSNKKVFLWTYERNGNTCINIKVDPQWRDLWRNTYASVLPGYHQNKEHWNTVILDGTVPAEDIKRMIAESYDLVVAKKKLCGQGDKMGQFEYRWTSGENKDFQRFYEITEEYYSKMVGGKDNRHAFIPYNMSESVTDVLITYIDDVAVGCAGLKGYSDCDVEVKRVWVEPDYRGKHIATNLMRILEKHAKQKGFQRMILQTRELMTDAIRLYSKCGYHRINNYPPYDKLEGAICFAKDL